MVAMTFLPLVAQEQSRTSGASARRRRCMWNVGLWMLDFGLGNGEADVGYWIFDAGFKIPSWVFRSGFDDRCKDFLDAGSFCQQAFGALGAKNVGIPS